MATRQTPWAPGPVTWAGPARTRSGREGHGGDALPGLDEDAAVALDGLLAADPTENESETTA